MSSITYKHVKFNSHQALCDHYNISMKRVNSLMTKLSVDFIRAFDILLDNMERHSNDTRIGNIVEYKGVVYLSHKNLCLDYNVPYQNIREYAHKHNISFVESLEIHLKNPTLLRSISNKKTKSIAIEFDGITYPSMKKLCEAYNVNRMSVSLYARKNNIDFLTSFKLHIGTSRRRVGKIVQYEGKEYSTYLDLCKAYNISYPVVRKFANTTGYDFLNSFKLLIDNPTLRSSRIIIFNNMIFKSKRALYKYYGIRNDSVVKLLKTGIDFNTAIRQILDKKENSKIDYNGYTYKNITDLLIAVNVRPSTIRNSKNKNPNATIKDSIDLALSIKRNFYFLGYYFGSIAEASRKLRIKSSSIQSVIKRSKCSTEQAVGIVLLEKINKVLHTNYVSIEDYLKENNISNSELFDHLAKLFRPYDLQADDNLSFTITYKGDIYKSLQSLFYDTGISDVINLL